MYGVPEPEALVFQGALQTSWGMRDYRHLTPLRHPVITWPWPHPYMHPYPLLTYYSLYELFMFIILIIFALCCFYCKYSPSLHSVF